MKKCPICLVNESGKASKYCNKCRWRRFVEADPVRASYIHSKSNAKRRGHEFTLTLDEFREFCIYTEYHIKKGRTRFGLSIDRKENDKGYTKDNIRVMPMGENAAKKTLSYDEYERRLSFKNKVIVEQGDCPF